MKLTDKEIDKIEEVCDIKLMDCQKEMLKKMSSHDNLVITMGASRGYIHARHLSMLMIAILAKEKDDE